ncbi:MAG TPA: caspase family protein [Saprospiraceae bacterium]|nr:caspase family protein [Saprospiraceae bacterium]
MTVKFTKHPNTSIFLPLRNRSNPLYRLFIQLLVLVLFSNYASAQTKHALIIAISTYEKGLWNNLSSEEDAVILKKVLLSRGFAEKDIHIIKGSVSKNEIIQSIQKHLVDNVKSGDIVFFHFSGHGQQIEDLNGDEEDGLDEALVASNAPPLNFLISKTNAEKIPYKYQYHVSDDELGALLTKSRKKLGSKGSMLVTIDACHSGTVTRGPLNNNVIMYSINDDNTGYRGISKPNVSDGWKAPLKMAEKRNDFFGNIGIDNTIANMVSFFASSSDERNKEIIKDFKPYCGSLTKALAEAITASDQQISYRALFDKVKGIMYNDVPNQRPMYEGNLDKVIFGGQLLENTFYFKVNFMNGQKEVTINGGSSHGLTDGTEVGFFLADTRDYKKAKPLYTGTLYNVGLGTSKILISDATVDLNKIVNSWVYVTKPLRVGLKTKIKIDPKSFLGRDSIQKIIAARAYLEVSYNEFEIELKFETNNNQNEIKMVHRTGWVMKIMPVSEILKNPFDFVQPLKEYTKANYLRNLYQAVVSDSIELVIEKVKNCTADVKKNWSCKEVLDKNVLNKPQPELIIGDTVRYKIINKSKKDLYYMLIEFTPDFSFNSGNILYPAKNQYQEYKVNAGSSFIGQLFSISEPLGLEQFTLISSEDWETLANVKPSLDTIRSGTSKSSEIFANSYLVKITPKPTLSQ